MVTVRPVAAGRNGGSVKRATQRVPRARARKTKTSASPVARALSALPPFGDVDPAAMRALTAGSRIVVLPKGRVLFREGDPSDDVYVVLSGALAVTVTEDEEHFVSTLRRGDLAGEIASIAGGNRSATVRASAAARLIKLRATAFGTMLSERPHLAERIAAEARRRLLEDGLTVLLHRVFGSLDDEIRDVLAQELEWVTLHRGEVLFARGDEADAAFIVVFGGIRLVTGDPAAAGPGDFDEAGPGEMIGSGALATGGTRNATAYAARDSYLVRLPRSALKALEERSPRSVLAITRALLERMKPGSPRHVPGRICVAVLGASSHVDLRHFVSKLGQELGGFSEVYHAWSARADATLGRAGIAQSSMNDVGHIALARWLHDLQHRHRIVLLEADADWTPWTERVVREADRILMVASEGPGPNEQRLAEMFPVGQRPRIAVLLHAKGSDAPAETAAKLAGRDVDEHYHVRSGVPGDFRRLARIVAGQSVALVLGGGGARGFAHIGVLRAMQELEIPVDLVCGASIGAIITALAGAELTADEMLATVEKGFSKLRDYTIPVVSVLKGKRTAQSIRNVFGGRGVEDLALPGFVVTTNLTRNQAAYHRRGELARMLRASTAIPGIYPPVVIDGDMHVDGGVLDNLPVEEMRRWHPDARIIAVDVTPSAGPRAKDDFGLWVSGMRAAGRTVRRDKQRKMPGLGETMVRVSVVASTRDRDRLVTEGAADLYLPLALKGVNTMDFETVRPVADRGYEQALPMIRSWLDAGGLDGRGE